jgi:hypothetical protein
LLLFDKESKPIFIRAASEMLNRRHEELDIEHPPFGAALRSEPREADS